MRQIHAAIRHFERQDYECAITLAAARRRHVAGDREAVFPSEGEGSNATLRPLFGQTNGETSWPSRMNSASDLI